MSAELEGMRDWSPESPSTPWDVLADGGEGVDNGISVTPKRSKTLSAFWQGLVTLSNDVAQLPILTYRRLDPKGKERAKDHPAYELLHARPNPNFGPFRFKELMMHSALLNGNGYAFLHRAPARSGPVESMWYLDPSTITPMRVKGEMYYEWHDAGKHEILRNTDILHLRGPGGDDFGGESVVALAKDSLAVGLQAQRYGSQFFSNDAKPGVVIEFPEAVDANAAKNILSAWEKRHGGASNAGRPAFLDRGGKVSSFAMSNDDAQFLESREFSRTEIASWFNLPPHKVGDLTRATFSNIEQQNISYVVNSLMPWLIRWQDEINLKVLNGSVEYFAEFLVAALLRGDYASRIDGHTKALQWGIMSIDEVRDMENLNPLPDGKGQEHYVPLNMTIVGAPPPTQGTKTASSPARMHADGKDRQIAAAFLQTELERAYSKLGNSIIKAATTPGKLQGYLQGEWTRVIGNIEQLLTTVASSVGWRDADDMADEMSNDFYRMVVAEMDADEDATLRARVTGRAKTIISTRPAEIVADFLRS